MNSKWKHMAGDWEKYFNHYVKFLVAKLFHAKTNQGKKTTPNGSVLLLSSMGKKQLLLHAPVGGMWVWKTDIILNYITLNSIFPKSVEKWAS